MSQQTQERAKRATLKEGEMKKRREQQIEYLRMRSIAFEKIRLKREEMRRNGIEPLPLEGFD